MTETYRGRAASAAPATPQTLEIAAPGTAVETRESQWPLKGQVASIGIRMTDAAAAGEPYAWQLYSEDPAAFPVGTELAEWLIAEAIDLTPAGGADERALSMFDSTTLDVLVEFDPPMIWTKSTPGARGSLWLVLTPGAAQEFTAIVEAGPRG